MSAYVPGDRVWVYMEGDGWWPARVLSDADVGSRTPGQDIAVLFYGGIDTPASLYELNSHSEAANICFFETSSSKAVTTNPELEAAIRHASEDVEANPLKTASVIAASAAGLVTAAGANATPTAAVSRATAKRVREMDDDDGDSADAGFRAGHGSTGSASLPGTHHLRPEELQRLAEKITSAAEAQNVAKVRAALCSLDGVDVFLTELEETKIGIAVGSVLNYAALKPLWPLARAIISFWARQLPAETLAAIRSVKQHETPSSALKEAVESASPTSPASPLSPLRRQTASPIAAAGGNNSSAFDNLGSPSTTTDGASQKPQRKSFFHNVRQLLDNPDDMTRVDDAVVEDVARRIVAEITDRDDRQMLLIRLREPDMDFLRSKLLSGEWTPRKYLEQPAEVFLTENQKAEDALRIKKKMEAVDAAANAGLNRTELFKCERCGKRDCTFYELQVRGADEPTTKYVTCLNCKHAWSQE